MRHLDLFSGIGGFALGLQRSRLDVETIGFCEIDKYATRVLNKNFPDVPVYHDVRTLDADRLGTIDIITGGYPCQPFSVAGKQRGTADDRHLWPEMHRIVATTRPTWVIAENVAGHIKLGLDQVLSDLENEDYTAWPVVIPACAKDASHRRDRVWIIASRNDADINSQRPHRAEVNKHRGSQPIDGEVSQSGQVREVLADTGDTGQRDTQDVADTSGSTGRDGRAPEYIGDKGRATPGTRAEGIQSKDGEARSDHAEQGGEDVANADSAGIQQRRGTRCPDEDGSDAGRVQRDGVQGREKEEGKVQAGTREEWWPTEPAVGRVAHGIPSRVDRLKGLGNAIVPQIVTEIANAIHAMNQGR